MKLISCVDSQYGIGKNNELLIKIPEDLKMFKEKTINNIVIMGRKTAESLPNCLPLKNRTNIILSNNNNNVVQNNFYVVDSFQLIFDIYKNKPKNKEIFVIGGEQTYKLLLPYCNTAYITKVNKNFNADTFINNFDIDPEWTLIEQSEDKFYNGIKYNFCTYQRKERNYI